MIQEAKFRINVTFETGNRVLSILYEAVLQECPMLNTEHLLALIFIFHMAHQLQKLFKPDCNESKEAVSSITE